jgi:transcriptional activator SPT8
MISCSNDSIRLWDLNWKEPKIEDKSDAGLRSASFSGSALVPFQVVSGHHGGMISSAALNEELGVLISTSGSRGWQGNASNNYCFIYELSMVV